MDFGALLRYWSLTLAVFLFYVFALTVALVDVFAGLAETVRKRRAERKASPLEPNPLAGKTVAGTIMPGPGQQLDAKREWVARVAEDIVRKLNPQPSVRTLVLEDSKGHPLVHFSNGSRLETYRFERAHVEAAMAGDATKVSEVAERLTRHLMADFLGREDVRPVRTTELAREAAPKTAAAAPKAAAATPANAPGSTSPASSPATPVTATPAPAPATPAPSSPPPATPAAPAATGAPVDVESMSREERLAAARAKAEALRAARQGQKPPSE
jgi:hypothetical protein